MELTDHQIKVLLICDAVRWGDLSMLTPYNYQLLVRAVAMGDPIINFEFNAAANHAIAWDNDPPPSPEAGPERSPWLETYDVEWWRLDAIDMAEPDLSYFEQAQ